MTTTDTRPTIDAGRLERYLDAQSAQVADLHDQLGVVQVRIILAWHAPDQTGRCPRCTRMSERTGQGAVEAPCPCAWEAATRMGLRTLDEIWQWWADR